MTSPCQLSAWLSYANVLVSSLLRWRESWTASRGRRSAAGRISPASSSRLLPGRGPLESQLPARGRPTSPDWHASPAFSRGRQMKASPLCLFFLLSVSRLVCIFPLSLSSIQPMGFSTGGGASRALSLSTAWPVIKLRSCCGRVHSVCPWMRFGVTGCQAVVIPERHNMNLGACAKEDGRESLQATFVGSQPDCVCSHQSGMTNTKDKISPSMVEDPSRPSFGLRSVIDPVLTLTVDLLSSSSSTSARILIILSSLRHARKESLVLGHCILTLGMVGGVGPCKTREARHGAKAHLIVVKWCYLNRHTDNIRTTD